MSPPPSTPTPRRFLLPKRSTQIASSQVQQTPPRFHSTPRFGAPGSSSVPRPTQLRIEDVDEDEEWVEEDGDDAERYDEEHALPSRREPGLSDSIEVESLGSLEQDEEEREDVKHEGGNGRIEIESDEPPMSPKHDEGHDHEEERLNRGEGEDPYDETSSVGHLSRDISPDERHVKRRKLSISPLPPTQHSPQARFDGEVEIFNDQKSPLDDSQASEDEQKTPDTKQPTFHPAPRFKPLSPSHADGLPLAFSPQRRGAKYLSGGLAATLQGWLSEVKSGEPGSETSSRVTITEVRPGKRMYVAIGDGEGKRLILAGEGKLTGLGGRARVRVGSVVDVGALVWDVDLGGEVWMVACDWSVES